MESTADNVDAETIQRYKSGLAEAQQRHRQVSVHSPLFLDPLDSESRDLYLR